MPLDILTLIAVIVLIGKDIIDYLLNKSELSKSLRILFFSITLLAVVLVVLADRRQESTMETMRDRLDYLLETNVEFAAGKFSCILDSSTNQWLTHMEFRTNPPIPARDIKIEVQCSDAIVYAECSRAASTPGVMGIENIQPVWVKEGMSFAFETDFLAANEVLIAETKSVRPQKEPFVRVTSWSRRPVDAGMPGL